MLIPSFPANAVVDFIVHGGPIMYPIVAVALFAVGVLIERIIWWTKLKKNRDPRLMDQVYAALEAGNIAEATRLSATTQDPVVRMINHGLNHHHSSMQGALEVAAGHELQSAGRFLGAMDTIITLSPLLGLLGTVTGIMGSFSAIGGSDLAVEKVTGGIGEALIATAAGLGIAIAVLVPMNFFNGLLAKLQFELEAGANNVLILTGRQVVEPTSARKA